MRISSGPRSKNNKNNDSTGRTTRSSSTPRSLRQSDLGVRRTQASGLKRDIADLKRQTKGLKKRSPVISRQARLETKLKIQQTTFMEEIPKKSAATNEDLTLGPTADATFIQGPEVSTNNGLDGEIENEAATVKEADIENESEVGYKKGNGDDEDGNENLIGDSLAGIVRNTDENGSDEDEPVDFAAVRGNETMKVKRKKRRRRFVPKKKPKMTTNSVQEVENVDARVKKRGRRVSTERPQEFVMSQQDKNGTTSRGDSSLIIKELQTSKGFVDKVDLDLKSDELMPMRRTPRMASLNAIAKVNAVLESYSPVAGKAASETREKCHYKKTEHGVRPKVDKRRKRSTSSVTQTDDIIFYTSIKGEHNEWMMSGSGDVFQQHTAEHQPISDSRVSSTSNWASEEEGTMTKDKAVQTVVNHKAVQTDLLLFDSSFAANSPSSCTCGYLDNVSSQEHASPGDDEATWPIPHVPCTVYRIPPTITTNTLNVPVCSSISTKTSTHTMAIPFTKTHMLAHTDAKQFEASPIISADGKKRMASLNAIAMMNAMKVLDRPLFGYEHGAVPSSSRIEKTYRQNYGTIRIPRINFQATSTSKFSIGGKSRPGGAVKSSHMKSLSNELEQLIENKRQAFRPSNKIINGWVFEGEPSEKPYAHEDRIIIRRYYPSMRRNEEVINIRDAVLLKSGPRKKDLPFVARVAAIWEEDEGHLAGDMMMSVFWYYRPEQTEVGKLAGYHGELEVLASRHRDDNSAACVVDKCYVLSYPQYCRFRAKNKLYRESRKAPLSPVPPTESTRPGIVPPENTDPNLVFFCRHAYDLRTGKIIKNPF